MSERVTTGLAKRYAEGGMTLGPAAVAGVALDLLDARERIATLERECHDLARWKVVAALLLEACDYTTEDIRENSDGAREQAEAIAAGVRKRFAELERERDEARAVAGCLRWYDHGADLWILRAGHKEVSRFNWPVRAFGHAAHHEAARAVCDALGLPFITAGLPGEERDDG